MDFKLISEYPSWLFLLCLLLGGVMTWLLYFFRKGSEYSKRTTWVLAVLRFLSISLLSFLLLSPMVRTTKRTVVKPTIIIGVDNSASMVMNQDSNFYRNQFISEITDLKSGLEKDYDVKVFNFGERVVADQNASYDDQLTDISELFKEINTRYFNRNVGALIVATDGIYNSGSDPLYEMRNTKYPVYTILAGDTVSKKDLRIQKISHNQIAFKGNRFPVEITLHATESAGETTTVRILDAENNVIFSQSISFSSSNQISNVPALLDANETGLMRLKVVVEAIDDELNVENNERDIFIEVRENKLKIALVSDFPHPDIAALQRVVNKSNNFETQVFLSNEFAGSSAESFNLIILNQLPSNRNPFVKQLEQIQKSNTPVLFILGPESNIPSFNGLNTGLTLVNYKGSQNEALPVLNPSFSLFLISDAQRKLFETLPPLVAPFASYNIANSAVVLAYQQVGSTKTEMPLVLFNESAMRRIGIIAGEGIWKWRMFDYVKNTTNDNFDEVIGKLFQYLTAQTDKSRFRIDYKNFYAENEVIVMNALLFNETYEPITEPEVTLEISDEHNRTFDFAFSAGEQSYALKMGTFEPGVYTFVAKAQLDGEILTKNGSFVVTDIVLENINLTANHRLLKALSMESGGKYYYPGKLNTLVEDIRDSEDVKSVSYATRNYMDLIDYFPLMILLFLLLGIEWFLRKYSGSY